MKPLDYSAWSVIRKALTNSRDWRPAWRTHEPQKSYNVVVIGGGGHGLATGYYLAKQHAIRRIAVLERRWIGGGNTGRATPLTFVCSFIDFRTNG
jgi:ribulose 1,5-bisphosphate synthetase/thiazole synthase